MHSINKNFIGRGRALRRRYQLSMNQLESESRRGVDSGFLDDCRRFMFSVRIEYKSRR